VNNRKLKILKNLFALALIALLIYMVDSRELWSALSLLTWRSVLFLGAVAFLLIYVSAFKWQLFIDVLGKRISIFKLFNLYLVGYFVNLVLPSYLGGDAVRSFYVGKEVGQHQALAATILERYTGLLAMLILGLLFMWFSALATWQIKLAIAALFLGLLAATGLALSPKLLSGFERISLLKPLIKHLHKIQEGLKLAKAHKALFIKAMLLSFLYHSLTVVNTMVCAYAVGWNSAPPLELFVVLPLILIAAALPVSPNGLGIQEGAFYFFLHGVGATPAQALAIGLVLRAKSYVLAFVGWFAWMFYKSEGSAVSAPQT